MSVNLQQLFGWSEQIWLWVDQIGILGGNLMFVVFIGGLVYGGLRRERLRAWLTRNRFPRVGKNASSGLEWEAVVFSVSNSEVPLWVLEQVVPKVVGLMVTDFSKDAGEKISAFAKKKGFRVLAPVLIDDPDDPAEARTKTGRLLEDVSALGYSKVAVDITGGKTPTSVGAFMAAEEAGVDTIYVSTEFDKEQRRPRMETARIRRISQPT